jgi:hypothetical protein
LFNRLFGVWGLGTAQSLEKKDPRLALVAIFHEPDHVPDHCVVRGDSDDVGNAVLDLRVRFIGRATVQRYDLVPLGYRFLGGESLRNALSDPSRIRHSQMIEEDRKCMPIIGMRFSNLPNIVNDDADPSKRGQKRPLRA